MTVVLRSHRQVRIVNRILKKMLIARKRRLKRRARWCCGLREDVPYFQMRHRELVLTHGSRWLDSFCDTCLLARDVASLDCLLLFHGELVANVEAALLAE